MNEFQEWSKQATQDNQTAVKHDNDKARYDLIPGQALDYLAQVYKFGAIKYGDRNWEKGMDWSRVFAAMLRHCWAFWRGEQLDEESKLPHMAHAAWGCLALLEYNLLKLGSDDRPYHTK